MSDPTAVPLHHHTAWLAVIGCGVALALCAGVYEASQTEAIRRQLSAYQQENEALHLKLLQADSGLQESLGALRQDLDATKVEANASLTEAQEAALRHADQVAGKIAQQGRAQAKQLSVELGKFREITDQAAARLDGIASDAGSVRSEVGSVRTDVESAKSNIETAKTDLQHVRGDLGVMSGLLATNGKEIQMLRDLGDRNIYEFTLARSSGLQKVGDVKVALRKTDVKRNRYTLDVLADDKRFEKKDKDANEPVQFYTSGARQPYELVINEVKKDQVTGYLATPKVTVSRTVADIDPTQVSGQ